MVLIHVSVVHGAWCALHVAYSVVHVCTLRIAYGVARLHVDRKAKDMLVVRLACGCCACAQAGTHRASSRRHYHRCGGLRDRRAGRYRCRLASRSTCVCQHVHTYARSCTFVRNCARAPHEGGHSRITLLLFITRYSYESCYLQRAIRRSLVIYDALLYDLLLNKNERTQGRTAHASIICYA